MTAIAAVVLAALAGVLVWKYASDAKHDAKKGFELVPVLVAKQKVPRDTSFDAALTRGLIAKDQFVKQDLPTGYVDGNRDDAALRTQFTNLVASHDIEPGQAIVLSDFAQQGSSQSGITGTLSTDETKAGKNNAEAISINVDDTHGVAGFIAPGDHVNVIMTGDIKDVQSGKTAKMTAFLLPGLKVLAVGSTTTSAAPQATTTNGQTTTAATQQVVNRNVITLEVNPRQAEQIAQANAVGQLYLTLMPATFKAGDQFSAPEEIVEAENLFDVPRLPDGSPQLNVLNNYLNKLRAAK